MYGTVRNVDRNLALIHQHYVIWLVKPTLTCVILYIQIGIMHVYDYLGVDHLKRGGRGTVFLCDQSFFRLPS